MPARMREPGDEPSLELVEGGARGAQSPFDALLQAAESDPQAAEGLALAYASMARDEREKLLSTVIADARGAARSPAGPLALLLSVEEDPRLAEAIAVALLEADDGALGGGSPDAGWIWGDEDDGGVAVVRRLHGGFVEVLRVAWAGGALDVEREPLARSDDLWAVRRRTGVPDAADRVGLDHAVVHLAEVLWRERLRRGSLPGQLRPFADLF
jgi:hypothetical protein